MTYYQNYIKALRKCAKEHDNDTTYTGHIVVSDLCRDTANLLESLEQEPFINKPCVSSGVCEHDKNKVLDKIRAEILEEKECAYADFDKYKVDYLGVDSRYIEDELPYDEFRYGMERCIDIIDRYKAESEVRNDKKRSRNT